MSVTRLDEPFSPSFGAEDETSTHILYECEALASLRHVRLGSTFFLEPQDINSISAGAIWNFSKEQGSHKLKWGTKGPSFNLLEPELFFLILAHTVYKM